MKSRKGGRLVREDAVEVVRVAGAADQGSIGQRRVERHTSLVFSAVSRRDPIIPPPRTTYPCGSIAVLSR